MPSPITIFEGVRKLNAGTYFVYDLKKREFRSYKYYNVKDKVIRRTSDFEKSVKHLDEILSLQ